MKAPSTRSHLPFLDISEYLLKELSPCFRPKIPEQHQAPSPLRLTPKLSPVIDGLTNFTKTPLALRALEIGSSVPELDLQDFNCFSLEGDESMKNEVKSKKIKKTKSRPRLHSTWHFVDVQLDMIVEEQKLNDEVFDCSDSQSSASSQDRDMMDFEESDIMGEKSFEEEKQSTTNFDLIINQEPIYLEWHQTNPKKQLLNKIKQAYAEQSKTDSERILEIKNNIENYIFDHEKFYFEESMSHLSGSLSSVLATLTKGIQQTFRKTIGGLSFENRRIKLVKYMEKKRRRVWRKKVNYDCRKKVADGRLRIKGKFVTYEQARQQLGVSSLEGYNADEIRDMLQKRAEL